MPERAAVRRRRAPLALAFVALLAPRARAVQLDALEPGREWRLAALTFRGNEAVSTDDLRKAMTTKARRWYEFWKFWRPLPAFEPLTFRADLEKLRQLHRNRGYYHARINHDIEL